MSITPKTSKRRKRGVPEGLWKRCPGCQRTIFSLEASKRLEVCPEEDCGYHFYVSATQRIEHVLDEGTFEEWDAEVSPTDPLEFSDKRKYIDRLVTEQNRTGLREAVVTGAGMIRARRVAFGVTDSAFIMGSMGSVVGEKLTRLIERATEQSLPLIIISGSGGGARMHEGILSLMQMAKVSAALARLDRARLPFLSILTDPTTGGVTASFAMLGDVILAEPRALIGFAGPRVIEQTIRQKLPEGFQRSEFLIEHGMLDLIVDRRDMKATLSRLLTFMSTSDSRTAALDESVATAQSLD